MEPGATQSGRLDLNQRSLAPKAGGHTNKLRQIVGLHGRSGRRCVFLRHQRRPMPYKTALDTALPYRCLDRCLPDRPSRLGTMNRDAAIFHRPFTFTNTRVPRPFRLPPPPMLVISHFASATTTGGYRRDRYKRKSDVHLASSLSLHREKVGRFLTKFPSVYRRGLGVNREHPLQLVRPSYFAWSIWYQSSPRTISRADTVRRKRSARGMLG